MDLKRFVGNAVVVQFKKDERWYLWVAPPKQSKATLPELVRTPDDAGNSVPVPMPFVQGIVTSDGDLVVNTGHGGTLLVSIEESSIASVTRILELATVEERSNLILPGN